MSEGLHAPLLDWFAEHGRDLPWRRQATPYAVWISEVMLQQTQVDRVVPYFQRWMERFPDLKTLAEAGQDDILKLWQGLGYYTRAANIHRAAQEIQSRHGGRMPDDLKALRQLPGIGDYTASAIASLAFGHDCPVIEANTVRVGSRLFDLDAPSDSAACRSRLREHLGSAMPPGQSGRFNQAVMDLGALVCLPGNPACTACPVSAYCLAKARGLQDKRPVKKAGKALSAIDVAAGVLVHQGRILIQKRPPRGLMANLWEFPGGKLDPGETPEAALKREFLEELDLRIEVGVRLMVIRHGYTRFRVTLYVHWAWPVSNPAELKLRAASDFRWALPSELGGYAFPSADRKLVAFLQSRDCRTL